MTQVINYPEIDPGNKIQLRPMGQLMHPACCAICGSGNRDVYVDLSLYYDYEGQVYICLEFCMQQIADTLGFLNLQEATFLRDMSNNLVVRNEELESELQNAQLRLKRYDDLFAGLPRIESPIAGGDTSVIDEQSVVEPAKEPDSGESVVKEPTTRRRSNDSQQSKLRNRDTNKFSV